MFGLSEQLRFVREVRSQAAARGAEVGRRAATVDRRIYAVAGLAAASLLVAFVGYTYPLWVSVPLPVFGSLVFHLAFVPVLGFLGAVGYAWLRYQAAFARSLAFATTLATVVILGLITTYLFVRALPAFQYMGVEIFTRTDGAWFGKGATSAFSLAPMIWGTVVTTVLAMLVAGPLGIAGALYISEIAPDWAREVVKPGIEIMAGIPSIVYGFLGFVVINEFVFEEMHLATFGSYVVVGLVVGVMALPTVVSVAEDALTNVPESMKSGALALGATDWQTMKGVTLPAAFSGVSAAVLLGVGRAIGETMAATVILGHVKQFPEPLYDVFANGETLTSVIAAEYGNASGLHMRGLFAAGVVLFVTVLFLSVVSQRVEARMERKLGGNR